MRAATSTPSVTITAVRRRSGRRCPNFRSFRPWGCPLFGSRPRRTHAVAFALFLCGCGIHGEQYLAPKPSQLVVHAVLDASATVQYVLVERAHAGTFKGKSTLAGNAEPVSGATVTITTPGGTVLLATEDPPMGPGAVLGQYRIALDGYGIARLAAGTYTLSVTTRESERVTGTTTLFADAPEPVQSAMQTALPTDTIHVRWPSVAGARSYEVRVTSSPKLDAYVVFGDS